MLHNYLCVVIDYHNIMPTWAKVVWNIYGVSCHSLIHVLAEVGRVLIPRLRVSGQFGVLHIVAEWRNSHIIDLILEEAV